VRPGSSQSASSIRAAPSQLSALTQAATPESCYEAGSMLSDLLPFATELLAFAAALVTLVALKKTSNG
jgi:hypothetical protein